MAESVIIEFISDTSQLTPAVDQLEQLNKVQKSSADQFKAANTEAQKQVKILDQVAASANKLGQSGIPLKKTLIDINNSLKGMSKTFVDEFQKGAADALKEAGVSAEEFETALSKTTEETSSLKLQLREMLTTLAEMKVRGEDNTEQYKELAHEAGHLKDAISDANREVTNFGSDTSNLDGLIGLAQGLAGGFAVVRSAEALFGDESEELQKTLLRVNAVMALLQGLQQIQIILQKESAASQFLSTIQTKAATAAQVIYNVVVGASTGLLKAFRIALASTGIGLFIFGLIELVKFLKSSNEELENANELIKEQKENYESLNEVINQRVSIEEAQAKAVNAAESEITRIQGRSLVNRKSYLQAQNKDLAEQRNQLDATSEAWFVLNRQIEENNNIINGIDTQIAVAAINLERQLSDERLKNITAGFEARIALTKKNSSEELALNKDLVHAQLNEALKTQVLTQNERIKLINEANKKIRDLELNFRKVLQEDRISGIEAELNAEQTKRESVSNVVSQKEIDLQKKLVQEKADLQLLQEGLTANQILEIKIKSVNDQLKLQRDFNRESEKISLENIISRNNKELSAIEVSDDKKLKLTIENIIAQAKIETDAVIGNSDKIKEINAKRDRDIKNARLASIQETLEREITLTQANSGELLRGISRNLDAQEKIRSASNSFERKRIEKQLGFQRLSVQEQNRLIDIQTAYATGAIGKRIDALNDERAQRLISQKDYNVQYAVLVDQQLEAFENGEKKKTEILNSESDRRREKTISDIQTGIDLATTAVSVLDSIYKNIADRQNNQLSESRDRLKELQDAGAITEKEAIARGKKLDAEEKKIRREQAEREKRIAVFNAGIAIPQSFLKGLTTGGPILGAIYAALAAVQFGLVASRPLPKFGKGKKSAYQGFAEVGETGAELIQKDGRMYVAKDPQVVWLGSSDKVFNPEETEAMLSKPGMNSSVVLSIPKEKGFSIDYKRLGKEVGKNIPEVGFNFDKNGFMSWQKYQNQFIKDLNKRRSF